MKTFKTFKEDMAAASVGGAPTNAVGTGCIAGAGVGPQGEPPGPKNILAKLFKRKRNGKVY